MSETKTTDEDRGAPAKAPRRGHLKDATKGHGDWRDALRWNDRNQLYAAPANAITILRHEEPWQGVLAWDEFRNGIVFLKPAPWHDDDGAAAPAGSLWAEDDDVRLQAWLLRRWSFNIGRPDCFAAARVVARERRVHPVRDWLSGLSWDGVRRISAVSRDTGAPATSWLTTYLGVELSPYSMLVGRWWLLSAVARIFSPGCQVDHALVLEGPQGAAKSTAVRLLAGVDWFSGAELEWHSKDKYLLIRGRWIYELAELAGLGKADLDRVKAFLTQRRDDYRGPYEKHPTSVERQVVFCGTVNPRADGTYPAFSDPTGNRRWWPVRCGVIDLDALERDRVQLWAEAVATRDDPDADQRRWWPATVEERALCEGEQEERRPEEVWAKKVETWLKTRGVDVKVSVDEVLTDALSKALRDCTEGDHRRAAACIRAAGWVYAGRPRGETSRVRLYKRPGDEEAGS